MRRVIYLFLFAIAFLIFKAFFLDAYLAEHYYKTDENSSVEANVSEEITQAASEPVPEAKPVANENNLSGMSAEKQEKKEEPEDKKMPLDRLGDKLSEHIKL